MRRRLKLILSRLTGKNPEAVVVSFLSGAPERASAMASEVLRLVPDRRHFFIRRAGEEAVPGGQTIFVGKESALRMAFKVHAALRRYWIGLAPVLFDGSPEYAPLRRTAFLLAPSRILAWNRRLERHHLRLRTPIASTLFLAGVPLDRIFLRPSWLFPWRRFSRAADRTRIPDWTREIEGRPLREGFRRIGILTPYFPYPLSHGGAVRIFNLLKESAQRFDLFLFSFVEQNQPVELEPILSYCSRVILAGKPHYREPRWSTWLPPDVCEYRSPVMRRALRRTVEEFGIELLQVEYTQLAPYGGDILVEHDVTFDLYQQVRRHRRSISAWWDWWRWLRFERRALGRFRRVVLMSDKDADLARSVLPPSGAEHLRVLPNGVDLERFQPSPEPQAARVLFVGSFRHFPNVVACRFLLEEIWPLVLRQAPEARLVLVGGPEHAFFWREFTGSDIPDRDPSVEWLGFVKDVVPLYRETNLVVTPTLVSAGTNLKVLEAMAMERAVVSTPSGCAGLGLTHGADVWVASDANAFAEAVVGLLRNPQRRRELALAARKLVERTYGWKQIAARQCELWNELLASAPGPAIRPATSADVAAIARIQELSPQAARWRPEDYLSYSCLLAEWDARPAGFLVWRETGQREKEILNLAVHPGYRRRGVARALLRHVLAGKEKEEWFLEVRESNQAAIMLYEQFGFRRVAIRPGYYDSPREAGIVMRLQS